MLKQTKTRFAWLSTNVQYAQLTCKIYILKVKIRKAGRLRAEVLLYLV